MPGWMLGALLLLGGCGAETSMSPQAPEPTRPADTASPRTPAPAAGEPATAARARMGLPAAPPRGEGVCLEGVHEQPTAYACASDDDCVVCYDGAGCGSVVDLAEYERRGEAPCQQPGASRCGYSVPRCCNDRCVPSSR